MSTASLSVARRRSNARTVLTAGAVVGVLDGLFAVSLCMVRNPACEVPRVFQGIAVGLIGRASLDGGMATAALGVLLHFTIATIWATIYAVVVRRAPVLQQFVRTKLGVVTIATVFGAIVWLTMNLVVVPLSQARPTPVFTTVWFILLIGHPVVVGLPITLIVRDGR